MGPLAEKYHHRSPLFQPLGGETRFPLADVSDESPLLRAAVRAAESGMTAIDDDVENAPREWAWLLEAAEDAANGVHVRPWRRVQNRHLQRALPFLPNVCA